MRITGAHRDAYLLSLAGVRPFDIAKSLQESYGGLYTVSQVNHMVDEMDRVVRLQYENMGNGGGAGAEAVGG